MLYGSYKFVVNKYLPDSIGSPFGTLPQSGTINTTDTVLYDSYKFVTKTIGQIVLVFTLDRLRTVYGLKEPSRAGYPTLQDFQNKEGNC